MSDKRSYAENLQIMVAWLYGEISEGKAARIIGVDRLELRTMSDIPANVPIPEQAQRAREHYEELAALAHHWSSIIPQAIDAWERERSQTHPAPAPDAEELRVTNEILAERERLLRAIPECKEHGPCVPHAIEWVNDAQHLARLFTEYDNHSAPMTGQWDEMRRLAALLVKPEGGG